MSEQSKPHVLIILDGWGVGKPTDRNAIFVAKPTNFNNYWKSFPHTKLKSWGTAVGLPEGEMGNSEVGHLTIGAGKIIKQHALNISIEITEGTFDTNPNLNNLARKFIGKTIHLGGLLSNAKVHSSVDHLIALHAFFSKTNRVYTHLFTDGRDSAPTGSQSFFDHLPADLRSSVVTVSGRYYGMDRDHNWDRTQKAYDAIVYGQGPRYDSFDQVVASSYTQELTDEFILPSVIGNYPGMNSDDVFLIFNFREDRIRQIASALSIPNFDKIDHKGESITTAALTEFEENSLTHIPFIYPKIRVTDTLSDKLAKHGLTQLHVAESEKYAHVTYFFDGGREAIQKGEQHIIIDSPDVATYDLKPEMSARKIADTVVENMNKFDFTVVNFANPDMVAHSGDETATIEAIHVTDTQIGRVVAKTQELGGHVYITSDHGNAEVLMHEGNSEVDTKHNRNPSPFIYIGPSKPIGIETMKGLSDIAPFIVKQMKITA